MDERTRMALGACSLLLVSIACGPKATLGDDTLTVEASSTGDPPNAVSMSRGSTPTGTSEGEDSTADEGNPASDPSEVGCPARVDLGVSLGYGVTLDPWPEGMSANDYTLDARCTVDTISPGLDVVQLECPLSETESTEAMLIGSGAATSLDAELERGDEVHLVANAYWENASRSLVLQDASADLLVALIEDDHLWPALLHPLVVDPTPVCEPIAEGPGEDGEVTPVRVDITLDALTVMLFGGSRSILPTADGTHAYEADLITAADTCCPARSQYVFVAYLLALDD